MGKIDENKRIKKEALYNSAYTLFTTKGINATAISDIVKNAGVAKGTFYLYFKDKYDIRNKLIVHKTKELLNDALEHMKQEKILGFEEQVIYIIDYVINVLYSDRALSNLISKNLVMGALRSTFLTGEDTDDEIYQTLHLMIAADSHAYNDVDVMLFTIVELAGSAGYNSMHYSEPLPIDEYKPFLYRAIRLIIESHREA